MSDEAARGPLQDALGGRLPKPCIPHQPHAQQLWHDAELHDLRVFDLGCGARRWSKQERCDAFAQGKCRPDGLWRTALTGDVPHVYPKPQGPNSLRLGTRGLRGVTIHVFQYLYKYIYVKMYITTISRGKRKKGKRKGDEADDLKPRAWWPALAQFHGPVPKASASCRHSKLRPAIGRTSRTNFGSWGMS
jgi:hypothetical protein